MTITEREENFYKKVRSTLERNDILEDIESLDGMIISSLFTSFKDLVDQSIKEERERIINGLPKLKCVRSDIVLDTLPEKYQCKYCENTWTHGQVVDYGLPDCKYKDHLLKD